MDKGIPLTWHLILKPEIEAIKGAIYDMSGEMLPDLKQPIGNTGILIEAPTSTSYKSSRFCGEPVENCNKCAEITCPFNPQNPNRQERL